MIFTDHIPLFPTKNQQAINSACSLKTGSACYVKMEPILYELIITFGKLGEYEGVPFFGSFRGFWVVISGRYSLRNPSRRDT